MPSFDWRRVGRQGYDLEGARGPSFTDFIGAFRTTNATKATLKIVPYLDSCITLQ
jgi:hypothetical protein